MEDIENPDRSKFTETINEGDKYTKLLKWLEDNGAKYPDLELVSYSPDVY